MSTSFRFLGAAGFEIVGPNSRILIDPFLTGHGSRPSRPRRSTGPTSSSSRTRLTTPRQHGRDRARTGAPVVCGGDVRHLLMDDGIPKKQIQRRSGASSCVSAGIIVRPAECHHWSMSTRKNGQVLTGTPLGLHRRDRAGRARLSLRRQLVFRHALHRRALPADRRPARLQPSPTSWRSTPCRPARSSPARCRPKKRPASPRCWTSRSPSPALLHTQPRNGRISGKGAGPRQERITPSHRATPRRHVRRRSRQGDAAAPDGTLAPVSASGEHRMKLVTYAKGGRRGVGVMRGGDVHRRRLRDMLGLIRDGDAGLAKARGPRRRQAPSPTTGCSRRSPSPARSSAPASTTGATATRTRLRLSRRARGGLHQAVERRHRSGRQHRHPADQRGHQAPGRLQRRLRGRVRRGLLPHARNVARRTPSTTSSATRSSTTSARAPCSSTTGRSISARASTRSARWAPASSPRTRCPTRRRCTSSRS